MGGVLGRIWRALWSQPVALSGPDWNRPYVGPNDLDDYGQETEEMRRAYRDLLKTEPAVRAAMEGKVAAVAATDVTVQPDDPDSPDDHRAAEFLKFAVDTSPCGWPGLIARVAEPAYLDGWSANEMVLGPVTGSRKWGGHWGLADFRSLDTLYLRLKTDTFRQVTGVVSIARGLHYLPREKFVIYSHADLFGNPFGTSVYRSVFRSANLIKSAYQLWHVALTYYAQPFVKGKYKDVQNKPALEKALKEARAGGWISLPATDDVEIVDLAAATSYQAFERKVDKLRQEIFLAVRGAYLPFTEGMNTMARGNTAVNKKTGSDQLEYMACASIGQAITRQLVPALIRPNFGPRVGLPRVVLGGVDYSEMGQQLDIASRILNEFRQPVGKKWLYRLANVEAPADPEDAIQPPAQAVATPGATNPSAGVGLGFSDGTDGKKKVGPADEPADRPFHCTTFSADAVLPIAGPHGDSIARHLAATAADGAEAFRELAAKAIRRLATDPQWKRATTLFTDSELTTLARALMQTITSADLLGRARIADHAARVTGRRTFAEGDQNNPNAGLPTQPEVMQRLPARIPALVPAEAVAYFKNLAPTLGVDPQRLLPTLQRRAFTLSVATEQTLLGKVQDVITRALETGERSAAVPGIQQLLDQAGVAPDNPAYADMVFRTNAMDAYHQGASAQLADLGDTFPVWQYLGIDDERERPTHRVQNDRYFANDVTFAAVRDAEKGDFDGFSCRCGSRPVDRYEWADLQAKGATLSTL